MQAGGGEVQETGTYAKQPGPAIGQELPRQRVRRHDTFRATPEDLGGGLGVTDPVSGEAVVDTSLIPTVDRLGLALLMLGLALLGVVALRRPR